MKEQCKTCKHLNMLDEICGLDATPLAEIAEGEEGCHGYAPRLMTVEEFLDSAEYQAKGVGEKEVLKKLKRVRRGLKMPILGKALRVMIEQAIAKDNHTVDRMPGENQE